MLANLLKSVSARISLGGVVLSVACVPAFAATGREPGGQERRISGLACRQVGLEGKRVPLLQLTVDLHEVGQGQRLRSQRPFPRLQDDLDAPILLLVEHAVALGALSAPAPTRLPSGSRDLAAGNAPVARSA